MMEKMDTPGIGVSGRQSPQQGRLVSVPADAGSDAAAQVEKHSLGLRRLVFGEHGNKIAVSPERQQSALIDAVLADRPVLAVQIVGEDAEGVGRRAHVEDIGDDVGPAGLFVAAGEEGFHIVGAIDFARPVDVIENGLGVVSVVVAVGLPAADGIR